METFDLDSNGYASDTLAYDNNGDLLYDGTQAYTYDAWNRLKTVAHAYRDGSNNLQSGQIFDTIGYDAAGRRITKAVNGTGAMDCTYNYYLNGQSVIEEQNGSGQSIEDHVWGLQYVDEAVQTRVNTNPTGMASWTGCWLCQDTNYNVLGTVTSTGMLTERYEYSAYGQRQVFISAGSNDPGCYTPTYGSTRVVTSGGVTQPYRINSIGHQGLLHDEETGLVYNRARMLQPTLGRFSQQDPAGYADSPSPYQYLKSEPTSRLDSLGLKADTCEIIPKSFRWLGGWIPIAVVPGSQPAGGDSGHMYPARVMYVRSYTHLWKCCDGANGTYVRWGEPLQALAFGSDSAQYWRAEDFTPPIGFGIGYGKGINLWKIIDKFINTDDIHFPFKVWMKGENPQGPADGIIATDPIFPHAPDELPSGYSSVSHIKCCDLDSWPWPKRLPHLPKPPAFHGPILKPTTP